MIAELEYENGGYGQNLYAGKSKNKKANKQGSIIKTKFPLSETILDSFPAEEAYISTNGTFEEAGGLMNVRNALQKWILGGVILSLLFSLVFILLAITNSLISTEASVFGTFSFMITALIFEWERRIRRKTIE